MIQIQFRPKNGSPLEYRWQIWDELGKFPNISTAIIDLEEALHITVSLPVIVGSFYDENSGSIISGSQTNCLNWLFRFVTAECDDVDEYDAQPNSPWKMDILNGNNSH